MNEGLKMIKQSTENKSVIFNKPRIIKNLLVVSLSFFLIFTACQGLNVLQSTINREHGIGTAGQGAVYVSFCISSVLLPKYMIKKLGCKMCLLLGMASFIPYLGANFSPTWYTIVSAAIFLGTGASIMWGTLCTYINLLSVLYCEICEKISKNNQSSKLNNTQNDIAPDKNSYRTKALTEAVSKEKLQNGLSGVSNLTNSFDELVKKDPVYYGTYRDTGDINKSIISCKNISKDNKFENSSVYGTVDIDISLERPRTYTNRSLIEFQRVYKTESINARFFGFHGFMYHSAMIFSNVLSYCLLTSDTYNETDFLQNSTYICGAQYCDQGFYQNQEEMTGISSGKRYALVGISVGIGTLGVLLLLLLLDDLGSKKEPVSLSLDLLLATVFHSIKKEQASLITLTLYYGLFEGFFIGDFTKSYVGCALGAYYIGMIAVVFGIGCALSSTISGILVKYIGRWPIFLGAQMINLGINTSLLMWIPNSKMIIPFFIIASAWGVFTGIIWSQLKAFYGTLFKGNEEVAFASYFVWTSVGYILSFSYSHYLCAFIKIYILIAVSCAGFLGYVYAEWILYTRKSTERE